jgi:hypothetical protein
MQTESRKNIPNDKNMRERDAIDTAGMEKTCSALKCVNAVTYF